MNRPRLSLTLPAFALAIAATFVLLTTPAVASDRILAMNVEADSLTAADRAALTTALRERLALYPGVAVVLPTASELTDEMIELECIDIDLSCLGRLAAKYRVDRVIYAQADAAGGGRLALRVKAADANEGKLIRDSRVEVAGAAQLAAALEAEVAAILGPVPAPPTAGTLLITTNVPSATIHLGAEVIGTGVASVSRPAGEYVIRVTHDGYDEIIEKVTIVADETTERRLELVMSSVTVVPPKDLGERVDDDDDGPSWVLWAVIGAVVVGGTVAIIAAASGGDDPPARAPLVFSIDPSNAWRDVGVQGGRP